MLYDISRTLAPQTATWPGTDPLSYHFPMQIKNGDSVNLSYITLTPHTATHADAGYHTSDAGLFPDQLPLEKYIGPAQVVTISRREGAIQPEEIAPLLKPNAPLERLLIHSWMSDNPDDVFSAEFPYPSVALIDWLADQGAVLLGLDSPSVDHFESKDLLGHNRLRERRMVHLEILQLNGVPDGEYELIALPLKLAGVCGSPVRAILRTLSD